MPEKSFSGLIEGRKKSDSKDFIVSELSFSMWSEVGVDEWPKARMVRSDHFKYTAFDSGEIREQLTDLREDPGEMINLVDSPDHQKILERHRKYLEDWCAKTHDNFH